MSKANPSSGTHRSHLGAPASELDLPKTIRFTVDNEDVHEVSWQRENDCHSPVKERAQGLKTSITFAHSPSERPVDQQEAIVKAPVTAKSAERFEERASRGQGVSLDTRPPQKGTIMPSQMTTYVSSRQSQDKQLTPNLASLWNSLLGSLHRIIAENYDVPPNLKQKHLRVFVPVTSPKTTQTVPIDAVDTYKELVCFEVLAKHSSKATRQSGSGSKLDFSSAVGRFKEKEENDYRGIFARQILFVCFSDPDVESPTSQSLSLEAQTADLRCPHFRNKCGIKRLVQTSKIGYSTFSSAEDVLAHNVAVHNEYKFKCSALICKQRFKTKQQMQNHQGSIHINRDSNSSDALVETLAFNKNQLFKEEDEEMKEEDLGSPVTQIKIPVAAVAVSEPPILRQKLKFKCPICLNRQFISKCKLDWHLKEHERQFKCTFEGCSSAFKQKQHLKNHLLTHAEGVRPFRCTYSNCGKAFKSISHLKDHTQSIHMKLKPFECVFCKSLFSRNSSLKYHIKSIHSQLVGPDGELSEQALTQLQILKDASPSPADLLPDTNAQIRKPARKERVHVKCEIDSSQIYSPPESSSQEQKSKPQTASPAKEPDEAREGALGQLHNVLQHAQLQSQLNRPSLTQLLSQASHQQNQMEINNAQSLQFKLEAANQNNQPAGQIKQKSEPQGPMITNQEAGLAPNQPVFSQSARRKTDLSPEKLPNSAQRSTEAGAGTATNQFNQVLDQIAARLMNLASQRPHSQSFQDLPRNPVLELQKLFMSSQAPQASLQPPQGHRQSSGDHGEAAPGTGGHHFTDNASVGVQRSAQGVNSSQIPSSLLRSNGGQGAFDRDLMAFQHNQQPQNQQQLLQLMAPTQVNQGLFFPNMVLQNTTQMPPMTINAGSGTLASGIQGPTVQQTQDALSSILAQAAQQQNQHRRRSNDIQIGGSQTQNKDVVMHLPQEQSAQQTPQKSKRYEGPSGTQGGSFQPSKPQ